MQSQVEGNGKFEGWARPLRFRATCPISFDATGLLAKGHRAEGFAGGRQRSGSCLFFPGLERTGWEGGQ